MKRLLLILPLLSACGTTPALEPRVITRTVETPIAAPCGVKVQRPGFPDTEEQLAAANPVNQILRYRAGWKINKAYINTLEAAVTGCGGTVSP